MTEQEAYEKIGKLIAEAGVLVSEAESIADAAGVGFSLDIGGYGMGGWYDHEAGWCASSHSC